MKHAGIIGISCAAACAGMLFFMYARGYLIIRTPHRIALEEQHSAALRPAKKTVTIFFWRNGWRHEAQDILWTEYPAANLRHIIANWLTVLDDERITEKKIQIQSIALSADGKHAYLSFDRTLLPKERSVYEKWHIIESLLKTVRDNGIPLDDIAFLVSHQHMQDAHLDFSHPWPVTGYKY